MVLSPAFLRGHSNEAPPAFIGWLFIFVATFVITLGWIYAIVVILSGRFLAKRINYTFCFVVACVECIFFPLGTLLGVFTLIVLTRQSARAKFLAHS